MRKKKSYISILKTLALLYICCLTFSGQLLGQLPDYHVQKLPVKSGLMQPSQVDEMMRDDKGFLWLLSPTKVQRFDGKSILSFSFDDACIGIEQDDKGTIWLLTRQNIYRYKNDFTGFEKLANYSSKLNKYLRLLAGPKKKLYLLSTKGILRWNSATDKMETIGALSFKMGGNFPFLQSYGDYIFFRLSNTTILRYNTATKAQDSVHVQQPSFLMPLDANNVWVRQGIGSTVLASFKTKKIAPFSKAQFNEPVTGNNFFITAAFENRPGEFFVMVNDKGFYTYNTNTTKFKKINFFNNGRLLTGKPLLTRNNFFKEKNGTVWFNNEAGLFFVNPATANMGLLRSGGGTSNSQWDNDIRNLTEDSKGNIWFSTANGFCNWDKTNGFVTTWLPNYTANNYLNYASVKSIGFSNNKIIIGQSEKGFWLFDPVAQTFSRPKFEKDSLQKKFHGEFNRNMLQLRNGNFLILSNNLWLLDKETFYIRPIIIPEFTGVGRKAFEDEQGRIWILGSAAIIVVDKEYKPLYLLNDKVLGKWFNAIVQKDDSTFWVAAKSLYEIKLQPQKKLGIKPIFPKLKNQHFSNLFKDSLGHIWMCHDEGMYRYIPEKNNSEKFDQSNNIQDFYVSLSNNYRGSDGTVYFGSLGGINYFVPEKIPVQNDSLQVQLLNVTINQDDSSFLLRHSLRNLPHSQNNIVFDFVSPWLYNPEKIQYRYKLVGDWVSLGNSSSVRFNSLQPGSYSFHAAASLNGKDWYALKAPYSFVINPPFYKTWWFLLFLFITIAASTTFFIRRRIGFIKKSEAEKTELQKIKAASYQVKLETEQVINYFATSISNKTTVDDLLWDVAKNCISKLGFEDCVIYLIDKDQKLLVQKAAWGPKTTEENKITNPIKIPFGKGIVGSVALSNKAEIVNDTSLDKRYIVDDDNRLSEISVPISIAEDVLGIIDCENSKKNFYTEKHLQVLTTIASLLANRITRIEAEQFAQKKEIEILTLKTSSYQYQLEVERIVGFFATAISSHNSIEDLLWEVSKNLIGKLGFEDCMIYLWNEDKTVLEQKAGYGKKGSMQEKLEKNIYHVPRGKGIVGAAVESKQYILANDTSTDKRYFTADEIIRLSELCVPIILNNEAIGAINAEHSEKNFYTERHLQILITIASMLADKIDRIEAQEQTRKKEIEVLKLSKDLATSQLTALRAQMNPHFLFNAMNSIQQFTLTNDIENANLYISKFSTLLRNVLHSSQQSFLTLEEELLQLELYLEIEKLRLGKEFSYFIQKETDLEVDAINIPGMLIQPFVENALKHGLAPKMGDKSLKIEIYLPELDTLNIIITDNGIGRQKANDLKLRQEKLLPHISKGLKLVEERLQLITGKPAFDFFHFEDNFDANGQAMGTTVTLTIPVATTNI